MKCLRYAPICLLFAFTQLNAQIDPLYAQYLNNPILINPGYTGVNNDLSGALSYRRQWSGFEGNPITLNANGQLSVLNNKLGVGLIMLNDKIGNTTNTEVYTTFSYKIFTTKGVLSFGIQSGFIHYVGNSGELNPYDATDPMFSSDLNVTKPSIGAGFVYKSDRIFLGLSMPRMIRQRNTYAAITTDLYSQHLYANAAYIIFLSESVRLKPSVLVKGVQGSPLSVDFSAAFNLDERYTAGLYTRNLNTYGTLLQIKMGRTYYLGYCFEIPSNQSVGIRYTTHELCLGIRMSLFEFHDTDRYGF